MYKVYLKQALSMLKENKLLSLISILGTALAIAMIMVIVIVWQVRTANFTPENNRDRMMYVKSAMAIYQEKWRSIQRPSLHVIKEVFYPLANTGAVSAVAPIQPKLVGLMDGTIEFRNDILYTDGAFWKMFDFTFIQGQPYTEEEVQSGIQKAVVCETTAKRLFGTIDIVGKTIQLGYVPYTVCAVIKDVSLLADAAYGNIWVPYSTNEQMMTSGAENLLGAFYCYILANNSSDFKAINDQVDQNVKQLNAGQVEQILDLSGYPDTQLGQLARKDIFSPPRINEWVLKYGVIITLLLLIPAINMSGMTLSRMRRRMAEIGLRKAFGASRGELINQVLYENMVLSLLGGIIGLILSYTAVFILRNWLFESGLSSFATSTLFINTNMVISPLIFLLAFLFCVILNLLSAGIPAWRASRMNIVDALNEN